MFFTFNMMLKCFRGPHEEISQDVKTGQKEGQPIIIVKFNFTTAVA